MKVLQIGGFRGFAPWFQCVERFAPAFDVIAITGGMLNTMLPMGPDAPQSQVMRAWVQRLAVATPVVYACGHDDPVDMDAWGIDNLTLAGDRDFRSHSWRIHVRDADDSGMQIETTSAQTIIVAHFPPALTLTAVDPHGEHYGDLALRQAIADAGDCRLALCGHVVDPASTTDFCEGAFIVNPGLSPHVRGGPAHAVIDCDRRSVRVFDGTKIVCYSFAR